MSDTPAATDLAWEEVSFLKRVTTLDEGAKLLAPDSCEGEAQEKYCMTNDTEESTKVAAANELGMTFLAESGRFQLDDWVSQTNSKRPTCQFVDLLIMCRGRF